MHKFPVLVSGYINHDWWTSFQFWFQVVLIMIDAPVLVSGYIKHDLSVWSLIHIQLWNLSKIKPPRGQLSCSESTGAWFTQFKLKKDFYIGNLFKVCLYSSGCSLDRFYCIYMMDQPAVLSMWCSPWKFKTFLFGLSYIHTSQNYIDR